MGFLDGEIAELVGTNLVEAGMSLPAALIKVTATARTPGNVTAATTPTTVSHRCDGFVEKLYKYQISKTLIANVSRVVAIYGSTLPAGVVPVPGDQIAISGLTTVVVNDDSGLKAVSVDPAGAVYHCQTR